MGEALSWPLYGSQVAFDGDKGEADVEIPLSTQTGQWIIGKYPIMAVV